MVELRTGERWLRGALRILGAGLLIAAVVYALPPLTGPLRSFYGELPFVANSAAKVTVLALASLYAAGDVRRRRGVVLAVIGAHLVSVAAMGVVLAFGETAQHVDMGFLGEPSVATVLWSAIGLDGAITAVVAALWLWARAGAPAAAPDPLVPDGPLAPQERRLRTLLVALCGVFALSGAAYLAGALLDGTKGTFVELPFVTNSVVLAGGLTLLCAYVAHDVRRNLPLTGPVLVALALAPLVMLLYLVFLDTGRPFPLWGWEPRLTDVLAALALLDVAIGALLLAMVRAAWRAREGIAFLAPLQQRGLLAVAETLLVAPAGELEQVPPRRIAANVEAYVRGVRAHRTWVYRAALMALELRPLLRAWPPLSQIEPHERRRFLERRFLKPPPWPRFAKNLTQVIIRIGQQLVFASYYNDRASWRSIGYAPFSEREHEPVAKRGPLPLRVHAPEEVGEAIEADVCIVGSGAGGATLAYELAKAGRSVLILERGPYVEPRDFSENEVEMVGRLYGDGVMQQTEDFRFTVLQGSCVGGSTTVNNAVCFRPPEPVLARWNDPAQHDAGLDLERLRASVAAVERQLDVHTQDEALLNRSGGLYLSGAEIAAPGQLDAAVVRANIRDCLGCGYCNIGCAYGRKLSMLDRTLPAAQAEFPGRVRIVAECEVERLRTVSGKPARVVELRAALGRDGRRVTVRAETFVLSAGAIGSSYLMLRSGIGGLLGLGPRLPVGRGLCFNMGAPLTAEMEQPVRAYEGLQISHYGIPSQNGFVFETWFNPPVAQAVNMPGWFEQHFANMRAYDRLMAVGVLVGTASNARVRRALTGGPGIAYKPEKRDLQTLARGLQMLGGVLFAAGAKRVMLNTWGYDELRGPGELDRIERIVSDPDYVTLGTGHPQGGNALSRSPKHGVVGADFRVHGYENLHVCDASVFPSSLTVNPQLTVMGLAHYAAQEIA
ncbi:MAG TPA: GMC family oxidoreductase [Conexibacter sp.]